MSGVALTSLERPVKIPVGGEEVFGIFHPAQDGSTDVGIICVNAGQQYRVGPHRIYVEAARRMSRAGYAVLRIDHPGIGDSEGEGGYPHFDSFPTDDVASAVDFMQNVVGIEHPVVLGMCAGARCALKAAAEDRRVDSVVLWSLPIHYTPPNSPTSQWYGHVLTKEASKHVLSGWASRAFKVSAWRKRFFGPNRKRLPIAQVLRGLRTHGDSDERVAAISRGLKSIVSSKRHAAFMYGEQDTVPREECVAALRRFRKRQRETLSYHIVPEGDHTFTSAAARSRVIEQTIEWLNRLYRKATA